MPLTNERHRRKILFFAEAVTLSHMARPAVLADLLDATEFEAVVARDPRYNSLFPTLQARQVDLLSIPGADFVAALAKGKPLYSELVLERYVEDDLGIIDREKPDIIIGDFRLSLSVSARLKKIPYVALSNAYWSPYARVSYTIPEHPLNRVLSVPAAELLFKLVRPIVFGLHTLPLNRVRKRHGMQSLGFSLNRVYTDSDYVCYMDVPSLVEMRALPGNHQFLGPVLWSPDHTYPEWWTQLDGSIPNIYLTMGSSGRSDLLSVVIDALRGMPVRLLVSTAGSGSPDIAAPNVFAADYLPGDAAANMSALVICNGGSLTTYQAFSQGVPVLGIAGNLDQHLNMLAIEKLGAGIRLRTDTLQAGQIRSAIHSLLQDAGYTRSALAIGKSMMVTNLADRFTRFLRAVL